ncbi:MAG: hypothetical protein C0502_07505 [Opitutus sp.]|nr:hypothetical protein [Opitutus sp.]
MKLSGLITSATAWPRWAAWLLVALFAAAVARFHEPGTGFTSLICFGDKFAENSLPVLQATAHDIQKGSWGYDGQFYAQLALDPTLRDPGLPNAIDNLPYRARRILFAWSAHLLGLGQPFWVLQAFALQNVLCWALIGWLLRRWIPLDSAFNLLRWAGVMFSSGLMCSVHRALTDGPSLLLIIIALRLLEQGRTGVGSLVLGINGLGRETNVLAAVLLPPPGRDARSWLRAFVCGLLAVAPLILWLAWLRHAYANGFDTGSRNLQAPFTGLAEKIGQTASLAFSGGRSWAPWSVATLAAYLVQSAFLGLHRDWKSPVWRLGMTTALFGLFLGSAVWEGEPGAFTRVLLPLNLAFNLRLQPGRTSHLVWAALGNLSVLHGFAEMRIPLLSSLF